MAEEDNRPVKKIMLVVSKGSLVDVLPGLVMGNGALMEGMKVDIFFTFFGLDAITKKQKGKQSVAAVGNPSLRLPVINMPLPNILGVIPGMSRMITWMMKRKIEKLDIPTVDEFLDMIKAGGGGIYGCKMAMDMFGLDKSDLRDDIDDVLTVGEFYSKTEEDTQIIFT